jgi:RimJ/RimL family protein N-acetyltransferase
MTSTIDARRGSADARDLAPVGLPAPRGADAVPVLEGRHVRLKPVDTGDYPFLVALQTNPENLIRWRYRGTTPSPEQIVQTLWQGVLAQFLIVRVDTNQPVGLVVGYNPEFRHGYVYLAMIVTSGCERSGWTFEADTLFITYLFETFPFEKVYLEVIEFNYRKLASGAGTFFHVEGCLIDHEYHLGRRWHLYTLAIYRREWPQILARVAPNVAAHPDRLRP